MANMDQTPLCFEFTDKQTYNMKGDRTVYLKETRSARCKPQMIFHGDVKGGKVCKQELSEMHTGADVLFNKKAYANEETMVHWLKTSYRVASPFTTDAEEPRLLALDAFKPHMKNDVRAEMARLRVTPSYIPAGCTRYVQPLDVAINQPLKAILKRLANIHHEDNRTEYEAGGKFRMVGNRWVLLTHLVAKVWDELHVKYKSTIIDSFRCVGLSLNPYGSEDGEIYIKGLENMKIGDWIARGADNLTQEQKGITAAAAAKPAAGKEKTQVLKEKNGTGKQAAKRTRVNSDVSDSELFDLEFTDEEESKGEEVEVAKAVVEVRTAFAPAAVVTEKWKHGWSRDYGPTRGFKATVIEGKREWGRLVKQFFTVEETTEKASEEHESEGWIELD